MEVCCHVMAHELLHAFDKCRAKFDITNLEHMACTEVLYLLNSLLENIRSHVKKKKKEIFIINKPLVNIH